MSHKEYFEKDTDLLYLIEKVVPHADYNYFVDQLTFKFEAFYGPISKSLTTENFRKLYFAVLLDSDREDKIESANYLLGRMNFQGMEATGFKHIVAAKILEKKVKNPEDLLKRLLF
jgi:hypothetical protein